MSLTIRGNETPQVNPISYVYLKDRIPRLHPLRPMRSMVHRTLTSLDNAFAAMYATTGRPSIRSECLLNTRPRKCLIFATRAEVFKRDIRAFASICCKANLNPPGLGIDELVWDSSAFAKNSDRLIEAEVGQGFFDQVLAQAAANDALSDEHFSVDGTLI